jgi:prepilin signal peptidase PulO-like enzyme (type II secretory pathway)
VWALTGPMAILIFVLSLILLIAGLASGYQSLNLLPTGLGVLYALAGAVAVCAAVLTFAIGVLIRRIDALTQLMQQSHAPAAFEAAPSTTAVQPELYAAAPTAEAGAAETEEESPININRTGHLPSLETIEETPEPKAPPSLIGSYSSAGANYRIYADGSIEAETGEGTFKFASMADFKRHLIETKGSREAGA